MGSDFTENAERSFAQRTKNLIFFVAQLFFLNSLLTIYLWFPTYQFYFLLKPSIELISVVTVLFIFNRITNSDTRVFLILTALLMFCLFFFNIGETVTRHLYRRSFQPSEDLPYFPEFIRLLFETRSPVQSALFVFLFSFLLGGIFFSFYFFAKAIRASLRKIPHPWVTYAVLLAVFLVPTLFIDPVRTIEPNGFTLILRSFDGKTRAETEPATSIEEEHKTFHGPFRRLAGRNSFLFIIESYGYTAFAKEDHFRILEPFFIETEKKLASAGYHMCSRFLTSPVIGGYSWYADATFLTGKRIRSKESYESLLGSNTPTMVSRFRDSGYTTVLAAPGTLNPWPEGERFYGFDLHFYDADFHYRGPDFSFVPITDQFTINTIHQKVVKPRKEESLFIEYILVSSHAPFNKIPAYIDIWGELEDGSIYYRSENQYFKNNWVHGLEYAEGYTAAVRYVMKTISDYLTRFIEDETFVIIIGDHQPKFPVTPREQPRSVPVHILCRNSRLVEPFEDHGFTSGFIPNGPPPHEGLERFLPIFSLIMDEKLDLN